MNLVKRLTFCGGVFLILIGCWAPVGVLAADYDSYKPKESSEASVSDFETLQALNPDVLGWLTIYGTQIDYPLLQTRDNQTYLSRNAEGDYAETGSIFLDYRNNPHFKDFNTIIYGHHVSTGQIFGEIKYFMEEPFFLEHRYGSIYYDGKARGLEILAILETTAYDKVIYQPAISNQEDKQAYYHYLLSKASLTRNVPVSASDHLVLLSTCFLGMTNGRHILVAKVTDNLEKQPMALKSNQSPHQNNLLETFKPHFNISKDILALVSFCLFILVVCLHLLVFHVKRQTRAYLARTASQPINPNYQEEEGI